MKTKRILSIILASVLVFGTMNIAVNAGEDITFFYDEENNAIVSNSAIKGLTVVEGMVDHSVYGPDVVYIQEDADMIEAYNEMVRKGIPLETINSTMDNPEPKPYEIQYHDWDWSSGYYYGGSYGAAAMFMPNYTFVPVDTALFFNAEVVDDDSTELPRITLNILETDGTLDYQGSIKLEKSDDEEQSDTYILENKRKNLAYKGHYVISLMCGSNAWESAYLEINFTSFD